MLADVRGCLICFKYYIESKLKRRFSHIYVGPVFDIVRVNLTLPSAWVRLALIPLVK
jgi:hypothetical protein